MRIEDEQTGGIIFLGMKRLCPAPFLYSKEGVKKQASAPKSAGEIPAISRDEPRTKEQSYVFSPTETHAKEQTPKNQN